MSLMEVLTMRDMPQPIEQSFLEHPQVTLKHIMMSLDHFLTREICCLSRRALRQ